MKKLMFKLLPYIVCVIIGFTLFFIQFFIDNFDIQNLVLNVAAGFISVSCVFLSYELAKFFIERKMRNKIITYMQYHIENSLFVIVKYFFAWFYPTERNTIILTDDRLDMLFSLNQQMLEKFFMERKMLGFFIYKNITPVIEEMVGVIKNPNLNIYMTPNEMVHFMDILRNITLIRQEILDFMPEDMDTRFVIKKDPNPNNHQLELFNKNIKIDYAEFETNDMDNEKLLQYFRVPTENIELLSSQIAWLLKDIYEIIDIMDIDFWKEEYAYGIKNTNI